MSSTCTSVAVPPGGPNPPRLWTRFDNNCSFDTSTDPTIFDKLNERRKAEVFLYKKNANPITKKQQYSNFSKGRNYTGKQSWATQTEIYTNPNVQNLPQIGYTLICSSKNNIPCAMSYDNDTPGPSIPICMRPNVPLYNYKTRRIYKAGGNKWPYNSGNPNK